MRTQTERKVVIQFLVLLLQPVAVVVAMLRKVTDNPFLVALVVLVVVRVAPAQLLALELVALERRIRATPVEMVGQMMVGPVAVVELVALVLMDNPLHWVVMVGSVFPHL
jgi:hypothetical protein